ncbi:MAG: M23 family metallopeptidase [Fimbriimonadaceae bacterium]|nr:M23 family metallopeptidase [Fimbriimonadaceae bacterium]
MRPWLWLLTGLALGRLPAAETVTGERTNDGSLCYRCVLVVEAPAGEGMRLADVRVQTFNRLGRLFSSRLLTAGELQTWAGGRVNLGPGQRLVITGRQVWPAGSDAARTVYVLRAQTSGGHELRLEQAFWLGPEGGLSEPAPVGPRPRFEVFSVPDALEAVQLGRSARMAWPVGLWLQETNGVGVSVQGLSWVARAAGGEVLAQGSLSAADLDALAGSHDCGPDGVLSIPSLDLPPNAAAAGELLVTVQGTAAGGGSCTALGRFSLQPPSGRTAKTSLRLPLRGVWRVAVGPGSGPHSGAAAYSWLFDRVDRAGQPFSGEGGRLRDHYAYGQPVYAPASGVLLEADDSHADPVNPQQGGRFGGGSGENYVLIDHGNGEASYLAGLQQFSLAPRQGQPVAVGDPLGAVGVTAGRPALLYRLLRLTPGRPSLAARFGGWQLLAPAASLTLPAGPETGDQVRIP